MTLIRCLITQFGIIQASDSNLSTGDAPAGIGTKVYDLGFCNGALAFTGLYDIAGQRMDEWMPAFIRTYTATDAPSLEGFANALKDVLSMELGDRSKNLYHIAGYVADTAGWHPEMWFVRNVDEIRDDGEYGEPGEWLISEEFWGQHYQQPGIPELLAGGGHFGYINGTAHGRAAMIQTSDLLWRMFATTLWYDPLNDFREPRSLDELAPIVDAELRMIGALYSSSDYFAPFIGGESQILLIPRPPEHVRVWTLAGHAADAPGGREER